MGRDQTRRDRHLHSQSPSSHGIREVKALRGWRRERERGGASYFSLTQYLYLCKTVTKLAPFQTTNDISSRPRKSTDVKIFLKIGTKFSSHTLYLLSLSLLFHYLVSLSPFSFMSFFPFLPDTPLPLSSSLSVYSHFHLFSLSPLSLFSIFPLPLLFCRIFTFSPFSLCLFVPSLSLSLFSLLSIPSSLPSL